MTDFYSIVQTKENEETFLSILPSKWCVRNGSTNDDNFRDLCYYPTNQAGHRLLEKAKKNPDLPVDVKVLRPFDCKIKRCGFSTYAEGLPHLKLMQSTSDTEECDDQKPLIKGKTAAELFASIQTRDSEIIDNNASSSSVIQSVPQSQTTTPNLLTYEVFKTTMDGVLAELKAQREEIKTQGEENGELKALVCQLTAKIDYLATRGSTFTTPKNSDIKLQESLFKPVNSEEELDLLEENCRNPEFVKRAVKSLGNIMGKNRFVGDGGTVCLEVIDHMFTRQFLTKCSMTGVSRGKVDENAAPKIVFQKYERSIDLFYQVVAYSDPNYPKNNVVNFVHRCLRNSKQRLEEKGERKASSRKRRKQPSGYVSVEEEANEEEAESAGGHQLDEGSQAYEIEVLEEFVLNKQ